MNRFLIMPIILKRKNECFVKCKFDKEKLNIIPIKTQKDSIETWDRYREIEAKLKKLHVIKCCMCNEKAVIIDNYYPFNSNQNCFCKYHLEKIKQKRCG